MLRNSFPDVGVYHDIHPNITTNSGLFGFSCVTFETYSNNPNGLYNLRHIHQIGLGIGEPSVLTLLASACSTEAFPEEVSLSAQLLPDACRL